MILETLLTLLLWNQNGNQNLATYSLRACGLNRRLFYHVGKFAAGSRQTLIKSLDLLGYYLNGSKHHPKVSKGILSLWIIQSFTLWHQMIQCIERNKRKLKEQTRKLKIPIWMKWTIVNIGTYSFHHWRSPLTKSHSIAFKGVFPYILEAIFGWK